MQAGRRAAPSSMADHTAQKPSWGAIADAVGRSVLVYVLVPTLVSLPGWLRSELANPLNFSDPVVTAFLPVRGFRALLNAFDAGENAGLLAGLLNGVFVCVWARWRGVPTGLRQRLLLGAASGAAASLLMIVAVLTFNWLDTGNLVVPLVAIAFESASGLVCGLIALPTLLRLLAPTDSAPLATDAPREPRRVTS
jgi:hypothetical protein